MTAVVKDNTYRHRNCTEVDMKVCAVQWEHKDYYKLRVLWVMRHITNGYHWDNVTLHKKDLKNWRLV